MMKKIFVIAVSAIAAASSLAARPVRAAARVFIRDPRASAGRTVLPLSFVRLDQGLVSMTTAAAIGIVVTTVPRDTGTAVAGPIAE
jgi:hypothetical protein